jgi:hypothetical protein
MKSKAAVVILNYNGKEYLTRFLPALLQHSKHPVFVADNASTDGSLAWLKTHYPEVKTLALKRNYGYAGGYNEALSSIQTDYYALVNSDVEVAPDWLDVLVGFLDQQEQYAAVQPKIMDYSYRDQFEYAGASGGFIDSLGYPYCRGRIFDHIEKDQGQYDSVIDVDWTSGACMVIRSEVFHQLGGFDAGFFAHMEEIDLCWRIRARGMKLACVPQSVVYHVGGGTLTHTSPFKTYLNFRNNLSLLIKNLPTSQWMWKIPLRMVLDGMAALKLFFDLSPAHFFAVIRAHGSFYRRVASDYRKRGVSLSSRRGSVLWAYYIKRLKRFSQLKHQ